MIDEFERALVRDMLALSESLTAAGHRFIPVVLDLGQIRDEALRDTIAALVTSAHEEHAKSWQSIDDAMDTLLGKRKKGDGE